MLHSDSDACQLSVHSLLSGGEVSAGRLLFSTVRHRSRISAPARVTSGLVCPIDGSQCPRGIGTMPYDWPEDTDFALWELDVAERHCPSCGRMMHVCDHRSRRFHTLE